MKWPSQYPDIRYIRLGCCSMTLNRPVMLKKRSILAGLKQFCKEVAQNSSTEMLESHWQLSQTLLTNLTSVESIPWEFTQ